MRKRLLPSRFYQTSLVQLYKQKRPMQQLSSQRFFNMKKLTASLVEALEVEGMKADILEAGTEFQIGGKPGMRVQFHLFEVKSLLAMKSRNKEETIIWSLDFQKCFNKEVSLVCLNTLATVAKVDGRVYRNW